MPTDPPSYHPQGAPRPRPDGATARPVGDEEPPRTRVMPAGQPTSETPSYAPGSRRGPADPTPTPPEYAVPTPGPGHEPPPTDQPPIAPPRPKRRRRGRKAALVLTFVLVLLLAWPIGLALAAHRALTAPAPT